LSGQRVRFCIPTNFKETFGMTPKKIENDLLEAMNDATAAQARDGVMASVSPHTLNALICEVQAWRRTNPGKVFASGPNEILELVDGPAF
jgi:hypothetical protein